jgi:hypothetical protein
MGVDALNLLVGDIFSLAEVPIINSACGFLTDCNTEAFKLRANLRLHHVIGNSNVSAVKLLCYHCGYFLERYDAYRAVVTREDNAAWLTELSQLTAHSAAVP